MKVPDLKCCGEMMDPVMLLMPSGKLWLCVSCKKTDRDDHGLSADEIDMAIGFVMRNRRAAGYYPGPTGVVQ